VGNRLRRIGTVGAVAYALFLDLVVVPQRRPKLELRFDHAGTDQIVVVTVAGNDAAYVRLRVRTKRERTRRTSWSRRRLMRSERAHSSVPRCRPGS